MTNFKRNKIWKIILLMITTDPIKYLRINLSKDAKNLYCENCKTLKEVEEIIRWKRN
jgi:RNase P subunit RPR2